MTSEKLKFRDEFQVKHFWLEDCSCKQFDTLQWTANSNLHLLYRAVVLVYCFCWFIADLALNKDPYYIAYLTHWGQIVMLMYFGVAFSVSMMSYVRCSTTKTIVISPEDRDSLRWYHMIMWILLNTYVTVAVVISISYWVGLSQDLISPSKSVLSANIHVHVVNTVLAFIEMILNNIPIRILHFCYPVALGVVYIFFTLILFWAGSISAVYAVLDWHSDPGKASVVAIGVITLAVPIFHFLITYGLFRIRVLIFKTYFSKSSKSRVEVSVVAKNETGVDGATLL